MPLYTPAPVKLIAKSGVKVDRASVNAAGDTTETALVTIPIAASLLGTGGYLVGYVAWLFTASATVKNLRVRLGGVAGMAARANSVSSATNTSLAMEFVIGNRALANAQIGHGAGGIDGLGAANGANVTGTVDTSAAADLVLSASWGAETSAELISVDSYLVQLVR